MKVFISWSGERSKAMALALKSWLPMVLQYVQPWVSDSDIGAGDRWAQQIAGELEAANFGVICITPENLTSEWILFEAGALSKSMSDGKVIHLLFDLDFKDLSGPLTQFQAKKADKAGLCEIVTAINKISATPVADSLVSSLLDALWPNIDKQLSAIMPVLGSGKVKRNAAEVTEEMVTALRGLENRVRDVLSEYSSRSRYVRKTRKPIEVLSQIEPLSSFEGGPLILLVTAGLLRDDFPWVSEVLVSAHRAITGEDQYAAEQAADTLFSLARMIGQGHPLMREMVSDNKEGFLLMRELPFLLERLAVSMNEYRPPSIRKRFRPKSTGLFTDEDLDAAISKP